MTAFVDTNYFLRFLLKDNEAQFAKAEQLFLDGAAGKIQLFSSTIVFFEIYWVLSSYYRKNKSALAATLNKVLALNFIDFEEKTLLQDSLAFYLRFNLDLEDSYNLAVARKKKARSLKTFDRKLLKAFAEIS